MTNADQASTPARIGASIRKLHLKGWLQRQLDAATPFEELAADWNFLLHVHSILPPADYDNLTAAVALRVRGKKASTSSAAVAAYERAEALLHEYAGVGVEPPAAARKR